MIVDATQLLVPKIVALGVPVQVRVGNVLVVMVVMPVAELVDDVSVKEVLAPLIVHTPSWYALAAKAAALVHWLLL